MSEAVNSAADLEHGPRWLSALGRSPLLRQAGFLLVLAVGIGYVLQHSAARTAMRPVDPGLVADVRQTGLAAAVEAVDREFQQAWQSAEIEPQPPADWRLVVRRMSLALTGMPPSLEQLRWAEQLPESQRIEMYLAHLLGDRRSHDYLAERLVRGWVGTEAGPFLVFRRQRLVDWVARQLEQNRPYDQMVREMLTARGLWTDHGPVNFFTAQADQNDDNRIDLISLTGRISRNFLGMRLDCLQCHDDYTGATELGDPGETREGLQTDFHGMAAFFGQTALAPTGLHDRRDRASYEALLLGDSDPTAIPPSVPYGQQWLPSSPGPAASLVSHASSNADSLDASDSSPRSDPAKGSNGSSVAVAHGNSEPLRRQFATWLTQPENRPFARAFVNRMWGILFGKPLVQPIDNLPLYGPFPPGLESLTDDFIANGCDIRRLIALMVHSEPFRRDSRGWGEVTEQHEQLWASFPQTKLRPEQMAGTISQAASLVSLDQSTHIITQLVRYGEQADFLTRYGDLGDQEFEQDGETVSQRLLLMNGQMAGQRLSRQDGLPFNTAVQLERLGASPQQIVNVLYQIVLARDPTPREVAAYLPAMEENRQEAIEDLLWVLINASEALWNH
jgi:hypothetical protein